MNKMSIFLRDSVRLGTVLVTALTLSACGGTNPQASSRGAMASAPATQYTPPPAATKAEIAKLGAMIRLLGPNVDPEEANRAARVAYESTQEQAIAYEITAPPLIHNMMVNSGAKKRGLCYQWADDLEARMRKENFKTLSLHRAIANAYNPLLIEHSTLIIGAKGDDMYSGLVLDPWRKGGVLTWAPVREDRYKWVPQAEVYAWKAKHNKK